MLDLKQLYSRRIAVPVTLFLSSPAFCWQCKILEQRLEQGMVFTEYERILKKRLVDGECSTARLPENAERNRFQDVLPYDDARVELVPTKENNTGYINASHIKVRGAFTVMTKTRGSEFKYRT